MLPKLSIITPSFNQAEFLERTICSVLDQGYKNLEYFIIDGGSTDGSVEIIRSYEAHLTGWISEPDRGQAHAINKGLRQATGEWVAWQNSDDIFYPGAFSTIAKAATDLHDADLIIGNINLIDSDDFILREMKYVRPTYRALLAEGMVLTNQAAFWRRGVHKELGYLDETLDCGFDYEWFLRLLHDHRAVHIDALMGGLRLHDQTKTHNRRSVFESEYQTVLRGRETGPIVKFYYLARRLLLTLLQGNIGYVLRGAKRRFVNLVYRQNWGRG